MSKRATLELRKMIGQNVAWWIKFRRMENKDLAEKMGVQPSQISQIISGDRVTLYEMQRVAKHLDIKIIDLFR